MEKSVVRIALFGLLLALVTTLPNKDDWDIYSFHINSTVTSRYAVTVITSRVVNRMEESKEIEFKVRIPKNAFISKFKMLIDGKEYDGVVKAKEQAQRQYSDAVSRGESAGLVSSVGRTLEEFKTSVTVAAHKKITFELTYEELLKRRLGKYELQIHARPMQPVRDFKVDVHINEKVGINFLDITGGLSTNALANAITKTLADKEAWVYFYPTEDQQKTCEGCGDEGLNGDLVISYDVNRDGSQGEIMTSDGYFVHHFAPSNLERISKNVVFVIDQSGSMHGRKIQQTRIALIHILNDLAEDDFFGLITFDSNIFHWKRELVQANRENVESAKRFAQNIRDNGATNINTALLEGTQMLNAHPREGSASILILLTDGDPTTGVTNLERIQSNVKRAIAGKFPLYCLGFGFDVNFEFLESMSLQNNGAARRIYEDADADLQLKGFYKEVATPLLTDVTLIYGGGTNLTQTNFSQYYNGSEIVVAGEITDNDILTLQPQVVAISNNRRIVFPESNAPVKSDSHIERVWAYLTVKQLMEKELQLSGPEKENVKKEAMRLSLKYNFVTPHTSMVVTKPPGENTDVLHKPKEGQASQQWDRAHMPTSSGQNYGYHPAVPPMLLPVAPGQIGPPGSGGRYSSPPVGGGVMSGLPGRVGSYGGPPVGGGVMFGLPGGGGVFGSSGRRGGYGGPPGHSRDLVGSNVLGYDTQGLPPLKGIQEVLAVPYPGLAATVASPQTMPAPVNSKLLLKAENQSTPLCFDVTGGLRLKLLHDPSSELSVNGELDSSAHGAFTRIMIHSGPELRIEVDNNGFSVTQGTITSYHTGQDSITVGGVTVISRDKEIDVAAGDIRLVILIHQKGGNKFLWPVLRQQLQDSNSEGILALKPVYEKVQTIPITKLKINNQEIDVTRSSATDFSIVSTPTVSCWFVSTDSALQRRLEDFIVTLL